MSVRAFLAATLAVCAIAACGELVGLGDPPTIESGDGGPDAMHVGPPGVASDAGDASDDQPAMADPYVACGIATGSTACQACMTASCCHANAACATSDACASYENCLMPCAGDYACRARCLIEFSPVAPEIAAVNACVADQCGGACGVSCGMSDSFAEPDAANGCSRCLSGSGNICTDWQACESNQECDQVALCAANCTTLDCQSACGYQHDAGAALYVKAVLDSVQCVGPCDIGAYWECVGNFEPRTNQAAETVLTLALSAPTASSAVGVHVTACPSTFDRNCSQPVDSATSDENGYVVLHLPVNSAELGFGGYFEISGPAIVPQLAFLEFPLSEAVATLTISLGEPNAIQNTYDQVNVPMDSSLATVWVATTDCHWTPSTGVTLQATGPDGPILTSYGPGSTSTEFLGWAFALNAPLGNIDLSVEVPKIGEIVEGVSIFTVQGTLSTITLHPNVVAAPTPPPPGGRRAPN